jgi:hypothetical protein
MNYALILGLEMGKCSNRPTDFTPAAVPLVLGLLSLWWVTQSRLDRFAMVFLQIAEEIMGPGLVRLEEDA